jgi:hypothetical protein
MKECGYTSRSTFQKHLQKANALDPELAELWKGHGAEWVRSE